MALKQKIHDRDFDLALQSILLNFQQLTASYQRGYIRLWDLQIISATLLALGNRPPTAFQCEGRSFFLRRRQPCI